MEPTTLDREEYVEQAYFFATFRERLSANMSAQDVLDRVGEELLATTRLPVAVQFLATELKHAGELASGFRRLGHYFAPFQAFVIGQAEREGRRFSMDSALQVLEREARYRAEGPARSGLFVYQFEAISRNRLGYDDGLKAMAGDPLYDAAWREYLEQVRRHVGVVDFGELVYVRSELYVSEQRRHDSEFEPSIQPIFGAKEGKIAKANLGRDPLFLFAALQRHLGYPEVPRPKTQDSAAGKLMALEVKFRELEARLKLVESEVRGQVDLQQFGKPELFKPIPPFEMG